MLMEVEELMKGWLTGFWCCLVTRPTADRCDHRVFGIS